MSYKFPGSDPIRLFSSCRKRQTIRVDGFVRAGEREDIMARKISVLLICSLLLLLAGCGGSSKNGSPKDKPWDLFTEEEAEEILGFEVEPEIQKIDPAGQRFVYYGAVQEDEKRFIQLSVVRSEDMEESLKEQGYSAKKMFEEAQNALSDNPQLVEGFGDEAFWISDSTDALHVLVGEVYLPPLVQTTAILPKPKSQKMRRESPQPPVANAS